MQSPADADRVHNAEQWPKFALAGRYRFDHCVLVRDVELFVTELRTAAEALARHIQISRVKVGDDRPPTLVQNGFDDGKADAGSAAAHKDSGRIGHGDQADAAVITPAGRQPRASSSARMSFLVILPYPDFGNSSQKNTRFGNL